MGKMQRQCIITMCILYACLFSWQYISPSLIDTHPTDETHIFTFQNWQRNADVYTSLGFSLVAIVQAKLKEIEIEQTYDLTAILLHWTGVERLQLTLDFLLQTQHFKEVIVWNNRPEINLTLEHLVRKNQSAKFTARIRIINSDRNLKDWAKYRACAEATTKACFYIDDDWNPSHYLRSLIASYRSDPHRLHSVTNAYTFYTNLVWSYFDPAIDLHTGFSWIGCGGVFLREHAQRHLQLLRIHLQNQSELLQLSDVFFSIWLNDVPTQLTADIRPQPSSSGGVAPFSSSSSFRQLQYISSVRAIRTLEHALRWNGSDSVSSDVTFPRQQRRRFPTYVKSPSYTDDLIFYTNILPVDLHKISFNISKDFARGTRRNLPRGAHVNHFSRHSTLKAVDGNPATCWQSHRDLRAGDFFALDFLRIQTNMTFLLMVGKSSIFLSDLEISISLDGLQWIPYQSGNGVSMKKNSTSDQPHAYFVDAAAFTSNFSSFRYLKYATTKLSERRFQVCEVQLVSRDRINLVKDTL